MATFNIVLDKRTELKNNKYNLAVRMVNVNDVMYINVSKMTQKQYDLVFIQKAKDKESIAFRETCNGYITKCERIFEELKPFNKTRFRELFKDKDKDAHHSLLLSTLFDAYIEKDENLKPKTKDAIKYTKNRLEDFKPGMSVGDVTINFLKRFEKKNLGNGISQATIDHHMRNLRLVINYFRDVEKIIPAQYEYPFGKGRFSVSSWFPDKPVLKEPEIKSVIEMKEFEAKEVEYARDIWLLLYRCNGANFADLLRMKWDQIQGDYIIFKRKKTESTRKSNKKNIVIPLTERLKESIERVGDKSSPFILGLLPEVYTDRFFDNKNHKIKQIINRDLAKIRTKLELSTPLQLGKARDAYASTLRRNGESVDDISKMLGHGNSIVTERYLSSINMEKTFDINKTLM
jgi:integrase